MPAPRSRAVKLIAAAGAAVWLGQAGPALAEPPSLRLLTFNAYIAWGISPNIEPRKQVLAEKIAELKPDIVVLQEVWNEEDASFIAEALAEKGLTHAQWVAAKGRPAIGSSGLMTASKYPLSKVTFRPYIAGRTPPVLFHLDWVANKGFLSVTVATPFGPVDVVNTHVHAQYTLYDYPDVRLMQMVELSTALGVRPQQLAHPMILAGDLNSTPSSFPVQYLQEVTGLQLVSEKLDIDLVLVRNQGSSTTLEPLETHEVLTDPMLFDGDVEDTLSDHPGLLSVFSVHTANTKAAQLAKPLLTGPDWVDRAKQSLESRASETRRWRWLPIGIAAVGTAGLAMYWRKNRNLKGQTRVRTVLGWLVYAITTVTIVWSVYLGSIYASDNLRDLERSINTLAALRSTVTEEPHESDRHH